MIVLSEFLLLLRSGLAIGLSNDVGEEREN